MKIKKESLKRKIWHKVSQGLIELAEHLPSTKKGIIAWLQVVRRDNIKFGNKKPSYIDLRLHSIWVSYMIPIEEFDKQIKSVIQILNEYKTKRFLPFGRRDSEIFEQLKKVKESTYGFSWHNIGLLDFKSSSHEHLIDYATIELQVYDGAFVNLVFHIYPSKVFFENIQTLISREVNQEVELFPPRNIKSLFTGWWGSSYPSETFVKYKKIQDEIQNLKAYFSKLIRNYFDGFFIQKDDLVPSTELWLYSQRQSPINWNERQNESRFWESTGMSIFSPNRYSSLSYKESIYWPETWNSDLSLKYLVNTDFRISSSKSTSIENDISHEANYWIPTLLSMWSFRIILMDLRTDLQSLRLKLYILLKRRFFNNPIKHSASFLKGKTLLNRVSSIIQKESLDRRFISSDFPQFVNEVYGRKHFFLKRLSSNVHFFLQESKSLMGECEELLGTTVNAKVIKTNLNMQFWIFFLAIITTLFTVFDRSQIQKYVTQWLNSILF